jgi:hypothetical protein
LLFIPPFGRRFIYLFDPQKLIKRTIFQDHVQFLNQRQGALLEELARLTAEGFPRAKEEWEKTVAQWGASFTTRRQFPYSFPCFFPPIAEAKQEKIKGAEVKVGGEESAAGAPPPSARQSTEDAASGMEQDPQPLAPTQEGGTPKAATGKADAHPPSKKYRMTETMKGIVWQLVGLSNECCKIENEKKCVSSLLLLLLLVVVC